ncbi:MAG: SDR family NAD(P)-dependent oxidoreductase [Eubacteriaceae bacterium]|nr:SDR family NAD(P)-dependent oxidoreductase [Eubacteriaceae bacterium]
MQLSGNSVLITGGATGIGFSMAQYLINRGNSVLICGRRQERLDEAATKLPGLLTFKCDVTNRAGREELFEFVKSNFAQMNVLVNNAGIQRDIDLTKGMEDFDRGESEIITNLEAPVLLSALFVDMLSKAENAAIINVSSGLGFMVERASGMPVYAATKAALHAFSIGQRIQLAPLGIEVLEFIPPAVQSELNMEGRAKRNPGGSSYMMAPERYIELTFEKVAQGEVEIRITG